VCKKKFCLSSIINSSGILACVLCHITLVLCYLHWFVGHKYVKLIVISSLLTFFLPLFSAAMYNNYGNPPGMQMPQQNSQPGQFNNPLYGASSGLIRSGLGVYGEKFLDSSSEFMQSNVRSLQSTLSLIFSFLAFSLNYWSCFVQINRYFSNPQYYFHVNDQYVRNKLKVILFPFFHRVNHLS